MAVRRRRNLFVRKLLLSHSTTSGQRTAASSSAAVGESGISQINRALHAGFAHFFCNLAPRIRLEPVCLRFVGFA